MMQNYSNTPRNSQGFSSSDQNLSESTDILRATVEESQQVVSYEQQVNIDIKWMQYFTNAVRTIRASLNEEDILETATEEVRRVIGCDRVVVYGLNEESMGVVIAESVAPGFVKAFGVIIEDPCFETKYIEKYQNGRVKATANIHEGGFSSCYIEQLEKLGVKANLVAPVINEGKLLGLLVAHQCSQPRHWQEYEIRWFSQIAMQVGFALENAKVLAEARNLRQQADIETEWTQHFTEAVRCIRQSLKQEDILEASTEEVRRLLKCDRVVVYGLNEESIGVVIAESVAPGFTKALGMTIKDPCFEVRYIEKYQNGRVKATPDIYQGGYSLCYTNQMEKLGVKANLVAPVINEGELLGLLVAHQCSQPRHWQEHEIRWFSQIAMQVGFALENAKVLSETSNLRLQAGKETEWTQYFTSVVRYIRQSLNQEDILKTASEEVRGLLGCDRVAVYGLNEESMGVIIAESVAPGFIKSLGVTIKDPCFEARYIEKYQNGRVKATPNIYDAGYTLCYIEQLEKLGVKANLVAPVINEGRLLGLLVAHQCSQTRHWQEHEIRWFSQIAMQVGFALENAKVLAETVDLRLQADTEIKWTHYFTDTVKLIRQSPNQENIFKTTVEEARRVIECDRVSVYGLNEGSKGMIIAESVTPRFIKTLGMTIKDPCFDAKYIEKYQNGRVKATDNIYEANLSSCYVEELEKLEVKANLVAPIINQGRLLGILVAHQCSQPRHWQKYEIKWFSQIAMQVGFALENAKVLAETVDLRLQADKETEWTQHFTDTIKLIRQSLNREDIFATSTEEVRRLLRCDRVAVYGLNEESMGVIIAESIIPGFIKTLGMTIKDPCFDAKYIEKYQNGRVKATDNIYEANLSSCYVEELEKLEVKANLVAPIINQGRLL
ncbi:MAG: GAF domain-containing protein, partial [Cyanobacteria bacterium P01_A01_bin.84]